ncbi:MAG: hypothetical protein KBC69_02200 [Candidatus Magasanikbacteria bacterium]|nr:hypothetical protein [Candidatus Magasanikbacteria bacterium]
MSSSTSLLALALAHGRAAGHDRDEAAPDAGQGLLRCRDLVHFGSETPEAESVVGGKRRYDK